MYLELKVAPPNVKRVVVPARAAVRPGVCPHGRDQLVPEALDIVAVPHVVADKPLVKALHFRVGKKSKSCSQK
jgi:hypothetical protein